MPSKLSGGKRATIKKHKEKKAARKRAAGGKNPGQAWRAKVAQRLGAVPKAAGDGHLWLGQAALLLVEETLTDTAVPLEQLRRDAMKQIEQASKVLDPAKLSEELELLHKAFKELKAAKAGKDSRQEQHAGDNAASKAGGAPPGAARP
jgi:hypothetical protein